jgi:hypothetical protein
MGIILSGAPCRDFHVPPAAQWLTHHELIAHAFPFILVVHPRWFALPGSLGRPHLTEQLFAGFVKTDHGIPRIIRQLVRLNDIFHAPDGSVLDVEMATLDKQSKGIAIDE